MLCAVAGLLTYSPRARSSHPPEKDSDKEWTLVIRAYSCGTVPELHRIPF